MPSFFKTLTVFVAVASASAKATLPASKLILSLLTERFPR
jgi:hypothetical protein